jgi:transcription initiation factor TFIIE subunit beta
MSHFKSATSEFKKRLADQPLIKRAVVTPIASQDDGPIYTGSNANPNNNGLQVFSSSKKKKTEVYSQPQDTGSGKHINSLLLNAINFLKTVDDPQTVDDLRRKGGVDLDAKPELYNLLKLNDKVAYDTRDHTFAYKPTYHIKNKEDLLALLEKRKGEGGMDYKELKDSYSKLLEAVNELASEGRILVVKNKDGAPRVLFWNDQRYNTAMDQEFRDIWHRLRIPDEIDLPKELEKAGLTHMQVFDKKGPGDIPKRKPVRRNRKMKITNTHMKGLDLTKDFVIQK